jgi:type IV pilus assembly protein PilA
MLYKLRRRAEEEKGFTLIELLVVILIIGILAAIAIPSFLNQRGKASDAGAKSQVKTMQTAIETYATDHNGDYSGATLAALQAIEPSLKDTSGATPVDPTGLSSTGYTLKSTAATTGDAFYITSASGQATRSCTPGGGGGNPGGCTNVANGVGSW